MSKKKQAAETVQPIRFTTPVVGTVFTVLSGLAFLLLMMCLPLVGPAGAVVSYHRANFYTFLAVLMVCTLFSVLALASKWQRRKQDRSPLPWISIGLTAVCAFIFVALFAGWFSI